MTKHSTRVAIILFVALLAIGCEKDGSTKFMSKSSDGASGSSFFIPEPEELIEDKETGLTVIKGVLNIHFSPKLPKTEAEKMIKGADGVIVGYDYSVNFFQVKFSLTGAELEKKRLEILAMRHVETVTPASVSVHKDPYYTK